MKKTGNFGRNARILALCGAALFATAANAQNTVITADKMVDVLTGKVIEFESDEIERIQHEIAAKHGYKIEGHALVLYVRKQT